MYKNMTDFLICNCTVMYKKNNEVKKKKNSKKYNYRPINVKIL